MIDIERQVAQEFAAERFPGTFEDVQARRVRRRKARWAVTAAAAATTAAVVAAGFAIVGPQNTRPPVVTTTPDATPDASPSAMSDAQFSAACAQEWNRHEMSGTLAVQPPLRFDARSGTQRMRIYASDVVAMDCEVTAAGKVQSGFMMGSPAGAGMWTGSGRGLPVLGSFSLGAANEASGHYLGRIPPGTTDITARIPGAPDIDALVDGDLFLIWQPHGKYRDMVFTARSQRATVVDALSGYASRADDRDATIDAFCRQLVADLVDHAGPVLSGVSAAATALAIKGGPGDHRIWVYRRGDLLVPCEVSSGRSTRIGAALLPDSADQWRAGGHAEVMTDDIGEGWRFAYGAAPDGLTSITIHLSDRTTAAATIRNGHFLAVWRTPDRQVRLDSVTATVHGTHYRIGLDGTVGIAG